MLKEFYFFLEVLEADGAAEKPSKCLNSKMNLRFTYTVVCGSSSFLLNAEQYFIVRIYFGVFIQSPIESALAPFPTILPTVDAMTGATAVTL